MCMYVCMYIYLNKYIYIDIWYISRMILNDFESPVGIASELQCFNVLHEIFSQIDCRMWRFTRFVIIFPPFQWINSSLYALGAGRQISPVRVPLGALWDMKWRMFLGQLSWRQRCKWEVFDCRVCMMRTTLKSPHVGLVNDDISARQLIRCVV